jgi:hypothetical protein
VESFLRSFAEGVFRGEGIAGWGLEIVHGRPTVKVDGLALVKGETDFARRVVRIYLQDSPILSEAQETVLHEVAHIKTGPGHGLLFQRELELLRQKYL